MSAVMGVEERAALESELGQLTGLGLQQFEDLEALPAEERAAVMAEWRSLSALGWTREKTTLDRVVEILTILGEVAGPAAVVMGAAQSLEGVIAGLRDL